jgi:ectoine hydroxylase-related dioxygenase (phytanoyl-CoA dioxygenase family)
MTSADRFATDGFLVVPDVIDAGTRDALVDTLAAMPPATGLRRLLQIDAVRNVATTLAAHPVLATVLPRDARAIQCTYFDKSPARNWSVGPHQDLSVPLDDDDAHTQPRLRKDGQWFTQPPVATLESLVAMRLQLDDVPGDAGALEVVRGSHRGGRLDEAGLRNAVATHGRDVVPVPRNGVLVLRPLLVHASRRLAGGVRRRVLHFVFAPRSRPIAETLAETRWEG